MTALDEMKIFSNYMPWNNVNIVLSLIKMEKNLFKFKLAKKKI